jgi:hypothetical protein
LKVFLLTSLLFLSACLPVSQSSFSLSVDDTDRYVLSEHILVDERFVAFVHVLDLLEREEVTEAGKERLSFLVSQQNPQNAALSEVYGAVNSSRSRASENFVRILHALYLEKFIEAHYSLLETEFNQLSSSESFNSYATDIFNRLFSVNQAARVEESILFTVKGTFSLEDSYVYLQPDASQSRNSYILDSSLFSAVSSLSETLKFEELGRLLSIDPYDISGLEQFQRSDVIQVFSTDFSALDVSDSTRFLLVENSTDRETLTVVVEPISWNWVGPFLVFLAVSLFAALVSWFRFFHKNKPKKLTFSSVPIDTPRYTKTWKLPHSN